MTLPLYRMASQPPTSRNPKGHAGLWFDKFCNRWLDVSGWTMQSRRQDCLEVNPKLEWIKTVTDPPVGTQAQVDACAQRLKRLIRARHGRFEVFTTESRFVTGLGRSHPVENGFAWHPTLGTPYLPGSSVKGLVRSWAKRDAEPRPDCQTLERLLGKGDQAGGVCFLDAIPVAPVQLEADVMTPHYAGWDKDNPPGDWRSPVPIPFLTSAPGTPFLFGLIPCRGATKADLDTVLRWLGSALEWAGAGAKTAVGYGRFRLGKVDTTASLQQSPTETPAKKPPVKAGDRVQAELLEEKTRKGGWKARHPESGLQGPIQNSSNVPAGARPRQQVELMVASVNLREMAFRWVEPS